MRAPLFWKHKTLLSAALLPVSALYWFLARVNTVGTPVKVSSRVICIGNLVAGGAGKTPVALALGTLLKERGRKAHFLSRGYKSDNVGVTQVDDERHSAEDVGDEPLLLAEVLPTWVSEDRAKGALAATKAGAEIIIMDDGFQNPSLHKDFSVLVVDARRGIGNARVFPAGPLRAPLDVQLARADALVVVGVESGADDVAAAARALSLPVFRATLTPDAAALAALAGARVLAFAGIGDPEKLFATLRRAGITVAATRSFADHHRYTPEDARALCDEADRASLVLVTTEKDIARIAGEPALAVLAARARALPVTLALPEGDALLRLLRAKLQLRRARSG